MTEVAIKVQNLQKAYGSVHVLKGLSFTIQRGEIFGLLGPNGAGKTTTLSIIEGILQADTGQVVVLGMDLSTHAAQIKRRIGVHLQSTSLLPDLTVLEQMLLFGRLYGVVINRERALSLLDKMGLRDMARHLPENLSGGQRQRLALAIALVNDPEILFLDEPTTGLDPQSRRALWNMVRQLRDEGRTIVLTTHHMEEAEMLTHRVGIIDNGELLALGTPCELIQQINQPALITLPDVLPAATLQSLPAIQHVAAEGGRTALYTHDERLTHHALMQLAQDRGLLLHDVRVQQPTLEDVFLRLTGRTFQSEARPESILT